MDIKSVLIEKEDITSLGVVSSSAILIKNKYVITTSNVLSTVFQKNKELVEGITAGKLHLYTGKKDFKFWVIWKCNNETTFVSRKASLFAFFKCQNIEEFCKHEFRDWSMDFNESYSNIKIFASIFLILAIENESVCEEDLKSVLYTWLCNIYSVSLAKGDRIVCRSTPFGTRDFLNSLSEGIISNTLNKSRLLLSDCSSAPGGQGGLIYAKHNCTWPLGIVISSLNWWRKEWTGFIIIACLQPVLCQMIGIDLIYNSNSQINTVNHVLASSENGLAQITCGADWGTCVLLSKEKGLFLTNSHVVSHGVNIRIIWRNNVLPACLIYKNPDDSVFDLAVIKCDKNVPLMSPCDTATVATCKCGDAVYCAGYPLLSTGSKPEGITITSGVISDCSPYMIKTTCGVFPGFSGGAVLNSAGILLGIIVCNTRLADSGVTYPKVNIAIPYKAVSDVILEYMRKNEDELVLTKLKSSNPEAIRMWMRLEGKL